MAREDPQASDENELEIGNEESEVEVSSSSESEEDSSDSESELEYVLTSVKRPFEDEEEIESKRFKIEVGEDFFEVYLMKQMMVYGLSESLLKKRWGKLSMETKKELEEEWMVLKAEEMRIERLKAKFVRDLLAAMGRVVVP